MASRAAMIAALLAGSAGVAPAQTPPDLAAAVLAYDAAQIKGDRVELERLLADDYLLVNSQGETETKALLIAEYTAPGFSLEPFAVEQPIQKAWADGAVTGGVTTLRGVDEGKRFQTRIRFADVWARRHGIWQVIFTQAGIAPSPATPPPTKPPAAN